MAKPATCKHEKGESKSYEKKEEAAMKKGFPAKKKPGKKK